LVGLTLAPLLNEGHETGAKMEGCHGHEMMDCHGHSHDACCAGDSTVCYHEGHACTAADSTAGHCSGHAKCEGEMKGCCKEGAGEMGKCCKGEAAGCEDKKGEGCEKKDCCKKAEH
jgi:hypothetical protein